MAVTPIENGDTVTQASIEAMHDDVRSVVNSLPEDSIGRHTFGSQHLNTLTSESAANAGQQYDYKEVTTERTIQNTTGVPESGNVTSWVAPADYALNNGGPGYVMRAGKVMVIAALEISKWGDGSGGAGSTDNEDRHQAWFALTYKISTGSETYEPKDVRMLFAEEDEDVEKPASLFASGRYAGRQHRHIVLHTVIDKSAEAGSWTLDFIKVRAILCKGGAGTGPNSLVIRRGTLSFIAVSDKT